MVHGEAAVGVAVVRDAEVGPVLDDGGLQEVEVGGAAAVVDVQAVGRGADRDDLGTGLREGLGSAPGGGAVRLVEDDLQAVEAVREHAEEVGDVLVEPSSYARTRPTPAPVGRSQGAPVRCSS